VKFVKMEGAGNDYIYVNGFEEKVADPSLLARAISDRHYGVGADGLILILPSDEADVEMRMWNADGSESEMCGNGIRCVGKYAWERGLARKTPMRVKTGAGVLTLELYPDGGRVDRVRADMGIPVLERGKIPMRGPGGRVVDEPLEAAGETFRVTAVSMGNPHCVIFVDDVDAVPIATWGPAVENHPSFPNRVNTEFVQVLSRDAVKQRTWERGAGETLACGTGASAVCVASILTGRTERNVRIHLRGGVLDLAWGTDDHVTVTGPATYVFEGDWPDGKERQWAAR
jgi:diaminopimelate epimerase